jgi:hypothetical protein
LGYIKIDGEDISELGLEFVRKAVAVIPQVSFIFKGSLRFNIDPMQSVPDSEIVSTLEDFGVYDLLVPEDFQSQDKVFRGEELIKGLRETAQGAHPGRRQEPFSGTTAVGLHHPGLGQETEDFTDGRGDFEHRPVHGQDHPDSPPRQVPGHHHM